MWKVHLSSFSYLSEINPYYLSGKAPRLMIISHSFSFIASNYCNTKYIISKAIINFVFNTSCSKVLETPERTSWNRYPSVAYHDDLSLTLKDTYTSSPCLQNTHQPPSAHPATTKTNKQAKKTHLGHARNYTKQFLPILSFDPYLRVGILSVMPILEIRRLWFKKVKYLAQN